MMRDEPKTLDTQIRAALRGLLESKYSNDSETLILDELAIWGGEIRADITVVNGCMHGFEIKSDADTLKRFPKQIEAYSAVFEHATLVASPRHIDKAIEILPEWWGLIAVATHGTEVELKQLRIEVSNPSLQGEAIAAFLWRNEALVILESLGLAAGVRTKPVSALIQRLAAHVPPPQLSHFVRQALRARGAWTVAARRKRCGVTRRPLATAKRFQYVFHSRIPQ